MSGKSNNILQAARFHKHCRAATDEIFGSLEVAETGNYWFNNQYNLFVTKETEKEREQYFLLKLEKYDGEDCVDFEFDTEDTVSNSEAQLLFAIGNIIERNSFLLDIYPEVYYQKAMAYAKASLYYYNKGDLRRAARYWNKIYSVKIKLSTENLVKVMRIFPSKAVYDITEEIKRASGYYDSMFPYKKKFPLLYGCTDHELIFTKLREEKLLFIERILYAYENGQIDFEEPKNDDGEYLFCGEAELICLDKKYKPTGLETTVLRWYESHEDTEFLIEVFSED